MKTIKFQSIVYKVKNKGTCFIQIPKHLANYFPLKKEVKVIINNRIEFFSNIRLWKATGVYVPADIAIRNNLFSKEVTVMVSGIEGFFSKILRDGRVYIPQDIANKNGLKKDDIILLEFKTDKHKISNYCKINFRQRNNTYEYFCMFTRKSGENLDGIFKIVKHFPYKKASISTSSNKDSFMFDNYAKINDNSAIIFHGKKIPILINTGIKIDEIAYYLGCYFADGTKKGVNWGICASTFKQAKYYRKMHEEIIQDYKIVYSLTYTDPYNEEKIILKNKLIHSWEKNTDIDLNNINVRILITEHRNIPNRNQYGSLVFKENRELTRIYYVRLLNLLLNKIRINKNKEVALDFILGVLEGDGSVGADRGHLMITTNLKELDILEKIVKIIGFAYRKRKEGKNKGFIFIGSLEIIENITILKDKLFKYYPKRREILKERLGQTGCARYLLGKSDKTSNWLIGQLNKRNILDGKGNLTEKGLEIKKNLSEFLITT